MLHSQDSFHELEEILRSLQEHCVTTEKGISTDHHTPESLSSKDNKHEGKLRDIPVLKVEYCDELQIEDILMEILLNQQLHTSKEYTLNGLSFKVYVLDDTEL